MKLTPRQDQILTYIMHNQNCDVYQISSELGMGTQSVRKILNYVRYNVLPSGHLKVTPEPCKYGRPRLLYSVKTFNMGA